MTHYGAQNINYPRGFTLIHLLLIITILAMLLAFLFPATRGVPEAGRRVQCTINLRQIAVGLRSYCDEHGVFPPAYTIDANGKPLHSWRTLILPYLDQRKLYDSIDLSKPWDDAANAQALQSIPNIYWCPNSDRQEYATHYLGIGGEKGCFAGGKPRPLAEITDKPEETLLVIEVRKGQEVPWMAPLDADEAMLLDFDASTEWPHPGGRNAGFVDGHAEFLNGGKPAAQIRRMMTVAGGD